MGQNYWLIILFVAVLVCNNGYCRPRELDLSNIHPVYRSVKQVDHDALNSFPESGAQRPETNSHDVSQEGKFNIESIATVARASNDGPSAPSSAVIGQFVDAVSQMVESDIRTPPKLKEILKEKNNDRRDVPVDRFRPMPVTFVYDDDDGKPEKVLQNDASEGKASSAKIVMNEGVKGVAIPVVMDDTDDPMEPINKLEKVEVTKPVKDERKKNGVTRNQVTTTPSSGLSTWILLSDNRDVATPPSKKSNKKDENSDDKKKMTTVAMTRKIVKVQSTTAKSTAPVKKVTPKPGNPETKKPETETTAISALEAMVKTQKKGLTTTTTTPKPKATEIKPSGQRKQTSDSKKKVAEKLDVAETKNKVEGTVQNTKTVYTLPPHFVIATEDPTAVNATQQNGSSSVTENTVEGTTKKKKTSAKKKKKNNNKKKKKTETGVEPKIPGQQVGSQIYEFLSREIVPTVGLGLIGVALTAGLASFLGYNPFASSTVPLRRTYETNHGYSPSNYYSYNTDYSDGGQSEEVLLREVLSGMPEESRYGLTHGDVTYSADSYNRNDQSYDRMKTPVYSSKTGTMYNPDKEPINYETTYSQEYSTGDNYEVQDKKFTPDYNEKYPVYTRETGTSFVYPETPAMTEVKSTRQGADSPAQNTKSEKYSKMTADTIERQPEALYRVAGEGDVKYRNGESSGQGISSQSHWHRMGTPVDSAKDYSRVEPGPRSLDFAKESGKAEDKKSRNKRAVGDNIQRIARKRTHKENDAENEIDFDDSTSDRLRNSEPNFVEFSTVKADAVTGMTKDEGTTVSTGKATEKMESSTTEGTKENSSEDDKDSNEDKKDEEEETTTAPYPIDDSENDSVANTSFLDILKRLAQFKLKVGLNFLRSTTDMFSRYLDVIQRKVDESFTNTTTVQYNRRKNPWSRIFYGGKSENLVRRKRSALEENPFLTSLLTEEGKLTERFSKSTKKELKTSGKMFYSKKSSPKKYEPKTRH